MKILSKVYHYNYILISTRKQKNITQAELAEIIGTHSSLISKIELLQNVSRHPNIDLILQDIADYFEIDFNVMFPPEYMEALYGGKLGYHRRYLTEINIGLLEAPNPILSLSSGDPTFEEASTIIDAKLVRDCLEQSALKPKEKKVIEMRYGLDDGETKTIETIARKFGVTRERIRQIEADGLARLRHPAIRRSLREMIGDSDGI
jgi:transcriptional regulator with XRE-family HTH domain